MKRYAIGFFHGAPAMFEQPEGDYVKWSDVKAATDGMVFAAAFGDKREITGLFDTASQAHAFVKWLQQFVQMDEPVTLGGGLPGDPNGTGTAGVPAVSAPTLTDEELADCGLLSELDEGNTGVMASPAPDERTAFEARFPKPDAVTWNGSEYEVREGWENSYRIDRFLGQWEAWKAARGVTASDGKTFSRETPTQS